MQNPYGPVKHLMNHFRNPFEVARYYWLRRARLVGCKISKHRSAGWRALHVYPFGIAMTGRSNITNAKQEAKVSP